MLTSGARRPPPRGGRQAPSFGAGIHYCVGAPLSRLEAQVAIPVLLSRLPRLRFGAGGAPVANVGQLAWPERTDAGVLKDALRDGTVTARLPEAYQWLLVPVQTSPQAAVEWQAFRLSGQDVLAVRASKKLRNDELLVTA